MTRDTFDRFQHQDRGRFGEYETDPVRFEDDQSYIGINLHLHTTRWEGSTLYLSRDGNRSSAQHVAKSLIHHPERVTHALVKSGSEATRLGHYHVKRWKLKQLGWLGGEEDERQGRLV